MTEDTPSAVDIARPFVGTWEEFTVTDDGEVLVGTLTTALDLDGCVLTQRFRSRDGTFEFRSFGYVDQATAQWHETYVFNDGRHGAYRWRPEGEEIVTERIDGNPDDLRRLRIRFVDPDLYEVMEEKSTDGGESWVDVELCRTRRVSA